MEEKEVKIILRIPPADFKNRIESRCFVARQSFFQTDVYFDRDRFLYLHAAAVRVRLGEPAGARYQYKKLFRLPSGRWFVWESPFPVDPVFLGLEKIAVIEKKRAVWVKGETQIVLDEIDGLDLIVELESESDPLPEVKKLLGGSEWERTVEGTSNLWLWKKKGWTEHLDFPNRFKTDPDWNVWDNERDWYENVKGESVGA